jgi:small subunit ribosomal protein S4e
MARKFGPRQLKREPSPGFWPIHRKEHTWAPRTMPGPHAREKSLPLVVIVRESLGLANTAKEAIRIISQGKVKVDGVIRRERRFPVGLMDVVQIEGAAQIYRALPKPRRGLVLTPAQDREAAYKICKIIGKQNVAGGKLQYSLHDGRTILSTTKDTRLGGEEFAVGGAFQLSFPAQKVVKYVPFQVGALGLVIDGRNQGYYGKITSITPGTSARRKIVRIETGDTGFETPADYVIPIGTDTPLVSMEKL